MKLLKTICFSCILLLSFAILVNAQTPTTKVGLINRKDFDDKTNGIKEVTGAYDKLDIEFKPQLESLNAMAEKLKKLAKYLIDTNRESQIVDPPREKLDGIVKEFEKTLNEYEQLACKYKSEEQKVKNQFKKREAETLKDVNAKIAEALKQFGKQNGLAVILDKTEEDNSPVIIDGEIIDITKDFIQYYNKNFAEIKTQ